MIRKKETAFRFKSAFRITIPPPDSFSPARALAVQPFRRMTFERRGIFKRCKTSRQPGRDLSERSFCCASLTGRAAPQDALYLLFKIPCERKRNLPKGLCPQSRRRDKPWAEGKVPPPDSQLSFTSQRISSSSTRYCFNSSGPQELEPTPLIP